MIDKKKSCIIEAQEGDAFWQPSVKGDCITIKVSPWNVTHTKHTVFLHELPNGGSVAEHSHETNEEIFVCLEGEGIITLDDEEKAFKKHDVAYIAPMSKHTIHTVSQEPLKYMVIISPTGLEDRLKLMGIVRKSKNELPPEAFDSEIGKQSSHGVI